MSRRIFSIVLTMILIIIMLIIMIMKQDSLTSEDNVIIIIETIKVLFIINCFIELEQFLVKKINLGITFILLSWLSNYIDKIHFKIPLGTIFYELFSLLGVFFLVYGLFISLKENQRYIKQFQKLAFYDPLTDLPNRNMLSSSCPLQNLKKCNDQSHCVCTTKKDLINTSTRSAFLFIDLDDFKQVNDNLGHNYGDILLQQVAKKLKGNINKYTKVVRLSSDEFLIILNDKIEGELNNLISNLLLSLNSAFLLEGKEVFISCSIGVAIYPDNGDNIETVLQKADIAMNVAKKKGKNQYFIYDKALDVDMNYRFEIINDIKNALLHNEFIIYYQPKANTCSNQITGLEALVRWVHPKYGFMYPNSFIYIAEEARLISKIDTYVLIEACKQLELWTKQNKPLFNISVNISPVFFNDDNFINQFDEIISPYQFDHSFLSVEITENIAINDVKNTVMKIKELKKRKIKVLLDDFGKGYSSLIYVKQFPVDYLKIDKNFINDILVNKIDQTIVTSAIKVSELMGIEVVFEGVETLEQLKILQTLGCHEYQGYLLSKPEPIEKIEKTFIFNDNIKNS